MHTAMNMYNAVTCTHTHLLEQYSNKSAGIYRNTEPKVHPQMRTHALRAHTHSEQRAEPLCQVAGGGSRLRTSREEEEERLLAGLESERHKRQRDAQVWMRPGEPWRGFLGTQAGGGGEALLGRFLGYIWAMVSPLCNREV